MIDPLFQATKSEVEKFENLTQLNRGDFFSFESLPKCASWENSESYSCSYVVNFGVSNEVLFGDNTMEPVFRNGMKEDRILLTSPSTWLQLHFPFPFFVWLSKGV